MWFFCHSIAPAFVAREQDNFTATRCFCRIVWNYKNALGRYGFGFGTIERAREKNRAKSGFHRSVSSDVIVQHSRHCRRLAHFLHPTCHHPSIHTYTHIHTLQSELRPDYTELWAKAEGLDLYVRHPISCVDTLQVRFNFCTWQAEWMNYSSIKVIVFLRFGLTVQHWPGEIWRLVFVGFLFWTTI